MGRDARSLIFLEKGVNPMTQIKKRATALLLGTVTFFMALVMPYNTTRVYAVDVGFTWVVNEYSNQILQWILLYLGISVAPEAISEGKVFDKTGEFAMDFCKEFFGDTFEQWYVSNGIGDDVDSFKKAVDDVLTTDWSSVGDAVAAIPSDILDTMYDYLDSRSAAFSGFYDDVNLSNIGSGSKIGDEISISDSSLEVYSPELGKVCNFDFGSYDYILTSCSSKVIALGNFVQRYKGGYYGYGYALYSLKPFTVVNRSTGKSLSAKLINDSFYSVSEYGTYINVRLDLSTIKFVWGCAYFSLNYITAKMFHDKYFSGGYEDDYYRGFVYYILSSASALVPNIDIPNVAGKDYAFDLVGWPDAWDVDKPDEKPWDGVDSLPIPGDVVLGDSIPGVIDFPDVIQKIIDGTIPWPDVIGAVRDIDIPGPDPDPDEPDKKPEPDPELPEIPAVLPPGVSDKLKDLSGKFPFCIPFDLVDCFKSFGSNEAAEAPKWDFTFKIPGTNKDYEFSVDLSMFDKYIPIFRSGVLILFLIGLILGTRKLIGWQVKN